MAHRGGSPLFVFPVGPVSAGEGLRVQIEILLKDALIQPAPVGTVLILQGVLKLGPYFARNAL